MSVHKDHYLLLDAVRGLAALAVFIYHLKTFVYPDTELGATEFFSKSYLAVDLFFLMSGLVIARSYESRLLSCAMTVKDFFWIRFIRLYPLYIAGLFLGVGYIVFRWFIKHEDPFDAFDLARGLFLNGLFIPDFFDEKLIFRINPAAWSLSLEWIINIIYAVVAVKFSNRVLLCIAGGGAALMMIMGLHEQTLDLGWSSENFIGGFVRILYSFTMGILLYRLIQSRGMPFKINALLLLPVIFIALIIPMAHHTVYYDLFLALVGFPLFVYLACATEVAQSFRRLFLISGQVSYALYILHTPLIMWMAGAWKMITKTDPQNDALISFLAISAGVLLVAYLATILFDEPVRKYSKKLFNL